MLRRQQRADLLERLRRRRCLVEVVVGRRRQWRQATAARIDERRWRRRDAVDRLRLLRRCRARALELLVGHQLARTSATRRRRAALAVLRRRLRRRTRRARCARPRRNRRLARCRDERRRRRRQARWRRRARCAFVRWNRSRAPHGVRRRRRRRGLARRILRRKRHRRSRWRLATRRLRAAATVAASGRAHARPPDEVVATRALPALDRADDIQPISPRVAGVRHRADRLSLANTASDSPTCWEGTSGACAGGCGDGCPAGGRLPRYFRRHRKARG